MQLPHTRAQKPLAQIVGGCGTGFLAVFVLTFAVNLLMLASPLYMMQVFDRVVPTGNLDTLLALTVLALLALAVLGLMDELRSRILVGIGDWIDRALAPEVVAGGVRMASMELQPTSQGLRDLATVRQFLGGPAVLPLIDAPWVPVFLAVLYLVHPWLGHTALAGAGLLFGLAVINEKWTAPGQQRANTAAAQAYARAESAMRNADTVTAMGLLPDLLRRWQGMAEDALQAQSGAARTSGALMAASKALRLALQIMVLGVGAYLVVLHQISSGAMIAASIIMSRALSPVEQSLGSWRSLVTARTAWHRLQVLLSCAGTSRQRIQLPAPKGRISVETLGYLPPGAERPILHAVSFELPAGASLGVIGPSGSGKSTLARLLVGAVPAGLGKVRLDGADLADWPEVQRSQLVGYLPQDVQLFDVNVRDNIARLGEVEDAVVTEAATRAGAHEMILQLPGGYDARVGDNGRALSGGQRQRIGLARALCGRPCMLVLDEPTASLDREGETQVIESIREAGRRGATVIVIDHKIGVIQHMDYVLVLRDGRMVAFGPRDEVLRGPAAPGALPGRAQRQVTVTAAPGRVRVVDGTEGDNG